jgi:predicted PurR-regulated permease PerM
MATPSSINLLRLIELLEILAEILHPEIGRPATVTGAGTLGLPMTWFENFQSLPRYYRWAIAFPVIMLNAWLLFRCIDLLQPVVNIVLTAALLAFVLDIPVRQLAQWGVPRRGAIALVLVLALILVVSAGLLVLPQIGQDLDRLQQLLPQWAEQAQARFDQLQTWSVEHHLPIDWQVELNEWVDQLTRWLEGFGDRGLGAIARLFDGLFNLILTGVLSLFLLIYGPTLAESLMPRLPVDWTQRLQEPVQNTLRRYLGGVLLQALLLSLNLTVALTLLKVPFAVLCGFSLGLSSLIPYLDQVVLVGLTGLTLLVNPSLALKLWGSSFVLGQFNDAFLEPRILGKAVGLNPVWVILAVLLGLNLFGGLGVFLAVPIAALIQQMLQASPTLDSLDTPSNSLQSTSTELS